MTYRILVANKYGDQTIKGIPAAELANRVHELVDALRVLYCSPFTITVESE